MTKPKSKLKRYPASDVVKRTPGLRLHVRLVENELEAFLLHIDENMITKVVERTNDQIGKVGKKINTDEYLFCYGDTNEEEIKCLFGLLHFRDLSRDNKHPAKEFWYDTFSAMKIYRAAKSLNRY